LYEGIFRRPKESPFIHHYPTSSPWFEAVNDVLQEKYLCRPSLVGKVGLGILAFSRFVLLSCDSPASLPVLT
jgi:hypothetical protein